MHTNDMALFRDNDTHFGIDGLRYDDGSFGSRHSFFEFNSALEIDILHTLFTGSYLSTVITTST